MNVNDNTVAFLLGSHFKIVGKKPDVSSDITSFFTSVLPMATVFFDWYNGMKEGWSVNSFHATVSLYPLKTSGGVERDQQHEVG